jgi:hypothetical protein
MNWTIFFVLVGAAYALFFSGGGEIGAQVTDETNANIINPVSPDGIWQYVGADGKPIALVNNVASRDVSYAELLEFIKMDQTDKHEYNNTSWMCGEYTETLHNNAENHAIRSAWVYISLQDDKNKSKSNYHSCNAFNTTDNGVVFIEQTNSPDTFGRDSIVQSMSIGDEYIVFLIEPENYVNQTTGNTTDEIVSFGSEGMIEDYTVYW